MWTKLDKMTVSHSLKKLATKELVIRFENANDTRVKSVRLTNAGKVLTHKLALIVEQIDAQFFGKVSSTEQQSLIKILRNLSSNPQPQINQF